MTISSFREQVIADFQDVFANTEEFGAIHLFNGRKIPMVISVSPPEVLLDYAPGEMKEAKEIICSIKDMPKPPRVTKPVNLDGVEYIVDDSKVEFAFVHVTLVRYSS